MGTDIDTLLEALRDSGDSTLHECADNLDADISNAIDALYGACRTIAEALRSLT